MTIKTSASYLFLRGNTWYFRQKVPVFAQGLLGKKEVKQSLKTRSRERALFLVQSAHEEFEKQLEGLRAFLCRGSGQITYLPAEESAIRSFCALYEFETLSNDEYLRFDGCLRPEFPIDRDERRQLLASLREAMALGNTEIIGRVLEDYQSIKHICFEGTDPKLERLQQAFLASVLQVQQLRVMRDEGQIVVSPEKPILSWVKTQAEIDAGILEQLWRWVKQKPDVTQETRDDYERTAREFFDFVDGRGFLEIDKADVFAYRDYLRDIEELSPKTINKRLGTLMTLSKEVFDDEPLTKNPFRGAKYGNLKKRSSRRPFSPEQLKTIFTSPIYEHHEIPRGGAGEAGYWIPLIALATGMRIREICQLRVDDIKLDYVASCHYFELVDLGEIKEEGVIVRLKNETAKRRIPIHQLLVDQGFIRYLEYVRHSGQLWLFPELRVDCKKNRSGNIVKWWSRWMRQTLGIQDPDVTFHSFRHLFKDIANDHSVVSEIRDVLMGHENQGSTKLYGSHISLERLDREMAKIRFQILRSCNLKPWVMPTQRAKD